MLRRMLLAAAALGWLGCALLGLDRESSARRLLEGARQSVGERDFDTAYRQLARIRSEHPESAASAEAFLLAAPIFKRRYFESRYAAPDSAWVTSEPGFMLDWFASFLGAPTFPQAQAEALFVGMPYGFFRDFLRLSEARPELARWSVYAPDDNGIIESIAAAPARERAEGG